eukprot:scaffold7136_cov42-Phaeocystis_antarctica.AAC.1
MVVALAGAGADHARLLEQCAGGGSCTPVHTARGGEAGGGGGGSVEARWGQSYLDLVLGVEVHREPLSEAAR